METPLAPKRVRGLNSHIGRLLARARRDEAGFTLIEFMVALGILFVALLSLARTATVALSDVGLARQRQTANQLANQLLEEVRGLPYEALEKGLSDTDLAGDANILFCSGDYHFRVCPPDATAEKIVHDTGIPNVSPLVPHRGSVGPPQYPATFNWSVYVTEAVGQPLEGAYRVTAIVSWNLTVRQGVRNFVEAQTLVYAPEGCVDTSTHPFGAPCQPYHFVTAGAGGGGLSSQGTVEGLSFDSFGFDHLREAADIQVEQITRVSGSLNLPSANRTVAGARSITGSSAVSIADTDPSSPAGSYATQSIGPQGPGDLSVSGGGNTIAVSLGGSDQGSTTSTTAAGGANSCNLQTDGRACGYSTGTAVGTASHTVSLTEGIGTASLGSVSSSSTPARTYVRRYVPPVSGEDGLTRGEVNWSLPEMRLGGLPDGVNDPLAWQGYWVRLTGYSASASAEAGTGSVAPALAIPTGQIDAWNGVGYTSVPISIGGGNVPITPVSVTDGVGGNTVRVEIEGTVTMDPSTTDQTILSGSTRSEAKAQIGSPMVVDLTYKVYRNDVLIVALTVKFNAGGSGVSAVYRPAPTP